MVKDVIYGTTDFNKKPRDGIAPNPIFCLDGGAYDYE